MLIATLRTTVTPGPLLGQFGLSFLSGGDLCMSWIWQLGSELVALGLFLGTSADKMSNPERDRSLKEIIETSSLSLMRGLISKCKPPT